MFDITPYAIGILTLLALFISTWLVPMIKSKLTASQQSIICNVVDVAVFAAEKLFGALRGQEKLAYATDQAIKRLAKYGIKLDASAVRPYIEAAVKALDIRSAAILEPVAEGPVPGLAEFLDDGEE